MQSDERKLEWHAPENLRWLADQEGRPDRVPCGFLTGQFLIRCADKMEAQGTEITALRDRVARLEEMMRLQLRSEADIAEEALARLYPGRKALSDSPPATDGV